MSVDAQERPAPSVDEQANIPRGSSQRKDEERHGKARQFAATIKNALLGDKSGSGDHHGLLNRIAKGELNDTSEATHDVAGGNRDKRQWFRRVLGKNSQGSPEASKQHPEHASGQHSVSLVQRGPDAIRLADLRDPALVGPEKYGKSLVSKHHKGVESPSDHESAQAQAYAEFTEKIDAGLVDPAAMTQEMCTKLEVSPDLEGIPDRYGDIASRVNTEVRNFLEANKINNDEAESIQTEVVAFTELYGNAYGKENIAMAYELVRDNARKLAYQTVADKTVFSGSDHGIRHILNGNTKFAMQMVGSLRDHGVTVSAKDQVIIHQVMIDHDLGYTTGAAQAEEGFDASKDHPLASTKFIEDNKDYYINKFGEDGYDAIKDSVLNHSYPRLEYQSKDTDGVHAELIRGVTSTVDSLGVTVETKTPEFFWNEDAIRVLLKIRLAAEVNNGKTPDILLDQYKEEMLLIASQEPNLGTKQSYETAINGFFNQRRADALGQCTGVVRSVSVDTVPLDTQSEFTQDGHHHVEGEDDHSDIGHQKLRLVVQITPTEVYALLGNMFGDRFANDSFNKAMGDLGLDTKQLAPYGRELAAARIGEGPLPDELHVEDPNARVTVSNKFLEDLSTDELTDIVGADKIKDLAKVFHEVHLLSVRTEINQVLDRLNGMDSESITHIMIDEIRDFFADSLTDKVDSGALDAGELNDLNELINKLRDPQGSEEARTALKSFVTGSEKEFLGIK